MSGLSHFYTNLVKMLLLMLSCSHIKLHVSERWLLFSLFPGSDLGLRFYTSGCSPQGFPVATTTLPVRIKLAHSLEGVAFCQSVRESEYTHTCFSVQAWPEALAL